MPCIGIFLLFLSVDAWAAQSPQRPKLGAFLRRDPASVRQRAIQRDSAATSDPASGAAKARYSLWEGLKAPLELPAEKVEDLSLDRANQLGRNDYDSHILQRRTLIERGSLKSLPGDNPGALSAAGNEIYVGLDFGPITGKAGPTQSELVDAVGFRPDPLFKNAADLAGENRTLWGWLPAEKLGDATRLRHMSRIQVVNRKPVQSLARASNEFLLGIRIPAADVSAIGAVFARVMKDLASDAGFRWKKTIGVQGIPGSRDGALLVVGDAPVRKLSRILSHPDVIKMMPAPLDGRSSAETSKAPNVPAVTQFLSYVRTQAPFLLVLTLLMLLPPFGESLARLAEIFIPYH